METNCLMEFGNHSPWRCNSISYHYHRDVSHIDIDESIISSNLIFAK